MGLRIGFFQYELAHPGNAPHVGMCLLLADLRRRGHDVDAALVQAGCGRVAELSAVPVRAEAIVVWAAERANY